jgi:hypothetical protein
MFIGKERQSPVRRYRFQQRAISLPRADQQRFFL